MVHSIYPVWKYIHARQNRYQELDPEGHLSSQAEYIFERMTGEVAVSTSIASGTGFMNIHTLEWDQEILDFAGLKKSQLSPIYDFEHTAPLREEAARELGLKPGTPVVLPGPDGALNQVGAGALGEGVMTMSVGTSGAIRLASEVPLLPPQPSTWCYYAAEGKRLAGAAISGAGNCVEWFVNKANLGNTDYRMLDEMAADIDREGAPVFLPFLYGERCPGWDDGRAGGFFDIKAHHGVGDLHYSILEGILFNLYQCYIALTQVGGTPREIRISGGIENSPLWLHMAADIFQREISTSKIEHASTMGAVVAALKVVGAIEDMNAFQPEPGETIVPDEKLGKLYEARFERYMEWYRKTGGE
jgi:gluconokinase